MYIIGFIHYLLVFLLFFLGLIGLIINSNNIKKLISLGILQAAIIIYFISLGFIIDAQVPIFNEYSLQLMQNPLPHVLMLTAIVVGLAINCLGMSILFKIKKIS